MGGFFQNSYTYRKKDKKKKVKKLGQEDSNKVTLNPKHGAPMGSRGSKIHEFKGALSSKDMTGE